MSPDHFPYQLQQKVQLLDIGLTGRITGLMYESAGYQYRVVWWSDGQRRCEWLCEHEIAEMRNAS